MITWQIPYGKIPWQKPTFLHSLYVQIKMFPNSLALFNQPTMGRTDHAHCFQIQLTKSCLVVWLWVDKRRVCCFFPLSLWKTVWVPRLDSRLMLSGIGLKFTFTLKHFFLCSKFMARFTLVHKRLFEVHGMWGAQSCMQTSY